MNGNGNGSPRVDAFNSLVRGGVTLVLTIGFLYLALRPKDGLDPALFANIYSVILGFWFGSGAAKLLTGEKPPSPPAPTTPETRP